MPYVVYQYLDDQTDAAPLTTLTDARAAIAFIRAWRRAAPGAGLIVTVDGHLVIDCPPLPDTRRPRPRP